MPSRRSHSKSRRGCLTCKQRRVKCDETGPPCGACKSRATRCEYSSPAPSSQPSPTTEDDANQVDDPVFPVNHRLLELQLMNRWSKRTYKDMCTKMAQDDFVWQTKVPNWSLQHDFLLDGLFAFTALEAARSSTHDRTRYVSAAMEYQTLAIRSFRAQLPNITPSSYEAMLCFSLFLMVLALASAQFVSDSERVERGGMVQSTIVYFELVRGCTTVLETNANYVAESPYMNKVTRFEDLPRMAIEQRTEDALTKLTALNERRIASSVAEPYESRVQQMSHWEACNKAISLLREFFAKCINLDHQGYILGWLNMAGDGYMLAIKADDRVALLTLMYWGVLIEILGYQAWWTRKFGALLVEDISNRMKDYDDIETIEVVLWAQTEIRRNIERLPVT